MTEEKAKVGNWVCWQVEVFKGFDPLADDSTPVSVRVQKEGRIGEVVEVIEGGCMVIPLQADDRPLALRDEQYKVIMK